MIKSDNIDKLAPALLRAQRKMGAAIKGSSNPFFKSKFADLNAVREACLPALNEEGISVLQPTVVIDGTNYVQTVLLHESGQMLASLTQIKTLKENDPQAEGSGISYARRYGLQSFTNLAAEDDDGEASMGRSKHSQGSTKQQVAAVTSTTIVNAKVEEQVAQHLNPTPATTKTTFRKPQAPQEAPGSEWV